MRQTLGFALIVLMVAGGAQFWAPPPGTPAVVSTDLILSTSEGEVIRVGPGDAAHFVGFLGNGEGAIGVALAPDGSFLAFTCGMRPHVDAWYSGDWYRGRLLTDGRVTVNAPDGEELVMERYPAGALVGALQSSTGTELAVETLRTDSQDGLFRRDDADGVLGAVALPGNTVCAVKRTVDDYFLPAGTVPY